MFSWSRAIVRALSVPLFVMFGQAVSKLWEVSTVHAVALCILFIPFAVAALILEDQHKTLSENRRR